MGASVGATVPTMVGAVVGVGVCTGGGAVAPQPPEEASDWLVSVTMFVTK